MPTGCAITQQMGMSALRETNMLQSLSRDRGKRALTFKMGNKGEETPPGRPIILR